MEDRSPFLPVFLLTCGEVHTRKKNFRLKLQKLYKLRGAFECYPYCTLVSLLITGYYILSVEIMTECSTEDFLVIITL